MREGGREGGRREEVLTLSVHTIKGEVGRGDEVVSKCVQFLGFGVHLKEGGREEGREGGREER